MNNLLSRTIDVFGFGSRPRITRDPEEVMEELRGALDTAFGTDTIMERAETLSTIFARQPMVIMVMKRDGEIVFVNRFAVEHLRWSRTQFIGSKYQEFVVAEHRAKTARADEGLSRGPIVGTFVNDWITGDDGRRSLLWFCSSLVGDKALSVAFPVDLCESTSCPKRVIPLAAP